ncbi:MAG: TetR/AcrR family transcriptional regulator [Anaerolineae bacterium]|nr:TetR/AcrR family transcriptional regulator [Anaerolineae bacterium]
MSSLLEKRKHELLDAASALLAINPTASLAEIAAHAGIGKATLHRYFASRDDLILALAIRSLTLLEEVITSARLGEGSFTQAFERLVEGLIPLADKFFFLLSEPVVNYDPHLAKAEQEVGLPVEKLVERGQQSGELRTDIPVKWILHVLDYLLYATWHAVYKGELAKNDAPGLVMTTLLQGFGKQP